MQPPGIHIDEAERLDALHALGILDTAPEAVFDRIVLLASRTLAMPVALLSFVDAERQWVKAGIGLGGTAWPRATSFCRHTLRGDATFIVPDPSERVPFRDSPLVTGAEQIRFYAGHPVVVGGARVGTLSVMDRRLRGFDAAACESLAALAAWVESELEARLGPSGDHGPSGRRYAALLTAMPDPVLRVSADGVVRGVHGGGIPFGVAASALVGRALADILPASVAAEHLHHLRSAIEGREGLVCACSLETPGGLLHVQTRFGRVSADEVLLVVRDVTEATDTADELRRSNAVFNKASEITGTGGWEYDMATHESRWSEQMYRNLEIDPSQPPDNFDEFQFRILPEHRARVHDQWTHALLSGATPDLEVPVETAKGRRRWMRVVGAAEREEGRRVRVYGAFQDITEQKEAILDRERREEQLRALGDNLPDAGIFQLETGAEAVPRFTFLSGSIAALVGVSVEEINRNPACLLSFLYDEDRRRLFLLAHAAVQQVSTIDVEVRIASTRGERWLHVRCVPRVTTNGGVRWDGLVLDQTRRREAEQNDALREQKLTALFRTSGDASFVVTHGGAVTMANPAADQMFGAETGGLVGVQLAELLPDWRGGSEPAEMRELLGVKRSGEPFHVASTTSTLDLAHHRRRVVVVRDRSVTRRLEHRLEERGELLADMQRLAAIGAWRFELRTGVLAVDEEFRRIHGFGETGEVHLDDLRPVVDEEDRPFMDRLMAEAAELRGPVEREFRVRHPDGVRHVLTRAEITFDDTGMPITFRGISQDITERRRIERDRNRLEEEREQLAQILDATPDLVGISDAEGHVLYLNRAGRRMVDAEPEGDIAALGLNISAYYAPWSGRLVQAVALPAARRDGVWVGESAIRTGTGGVVPVAQTILAHRSADGTVERFSTIARDISPQKDTERALASARLRAEEANRAKSAFLANMSHELRTPLNAIIGFSDLLSQQMFGVLNPRQADYVSHVLAGGRHLLALINDILDLSKVEAGRLSLDLVETTVAPLLQPVCAAMQPVAERGGVGLDLILPPGLPLVRVDVTRIRQILTNLVSNACKFTPRGGRIRVEASVADGEVSLSVTDTGIGVGAEDLRRVFDEFEQLAFSAGAHMDGTGLGLALGRRLAELHGGRLDVRSEVGVGSTFSLRLPQAAPLASPVTRVLLVGHAPAVARLLGGHLEQAGLTVDVAANLHAACNMLARRTPDALVLDPDLRVAAAADGPFATISARIPAPILYLGGALDEPVAGALGVPITRWEALVQLRRSGVPLGPLAGLRVWLFDPDQALSQVEAAVRAAGAMTRRAAALDGAVAFDADLIIHGVTGSDSTPARHATIPLLLIPAMCPIDDIARHVSGAMLDRAVRSH
ncbi:MAG: PAS domain S-box protein [Pseudomonadota bacterium]|nr:PAS domain S-box protein [Pseudomonadota bacterium]